MERIRVVLSRLHDRLRPTVAIIEGSIPTAWRHTVPANNNNHPKIHATIREVPTREVPVRFPRHSLHRAPIIHRVQRFEGPLPETMLPSNKFEVSIPTMPTRRRLHFPRLPTTKRTIRLEARPESLRVESIPIKISVHFLWRCFP